jgi:hypothetical protein
MIKNNHRRASSMIKFSNNLFKDLFPNKNKIKQTKQLFGDKTQLKEIDTSYLNKISKYIKEDKLTDFLNKNNLFFNNFEKNFNNLNDEKKHHHNNFSIHSDSSYDSLGNKKEKGDPTVSRW